MENINHNGLEQVIQGLEQRKYQPRILKELFEV